MYGALLSILGHFYNTFLSFSDSEVNEEEIQEMQTLIVFLKSQMDELQQQVS